MIIRGTCSSMEVIWKTHFVEEAASDIEVKLTVILTAIYPEIYGDDGFRVGGEETGGDKVKNGIGRYGVFDSFVAVCAGDCEVVFSATVFFAVVNELSRDFQLIERTKELGIMYLLE
jgi:hypothetical protein